MSHEVTIEVWSDYVCPFCYLEEPVLEHLRHQEGESLRVQWHAFELRPAPVPTLEPNGEYLRDSWARAVYPMAERRGMTLRLPSLQPRSRKALEAAEYARDHGRYDAMHHALFRAFFEEGQDIGSLDVLVEVGAAVGVDGDGLREALESDVYLERVLSDERRAQELGISGVPALLVRRSDRPLEQAARLSGAQPFEEVKRAVERIRASW